MFLSVVAARQCLLGSDDGNLGNSARKIASHQTSRARSCHFVPPECLKPIVFVMTAYVMPVTSGTQMRYSLRASHVHNRTWRRMYLRYRPAVSIAPR